MWRNIVDLTVVLMSSRGCLTQEKIVASCAKQFVIIADDRYMNGIFLINYANKRFFFEVGLVSCTNTIRNLGEFEGSVKLRQLERVDLLSNHELSETFLDITDHQVTCMWARSCKPLTVMCLYISI